MKCRRCKHINPIDSDTCEVCFSNELSGYTIDKETGEYGYRYAYGKFIPIEEIPIFEV